MISDCSDFITRLGAALAPMADPARAAGMAAYMRHRFEFMGVATPERRRAATPLIRAHAGDPVATATALWELPQREYQYVACDLLRYRAGKLHAAHLPVLAALVTAKAWWDTVDSLAVTIGDIALRDASATSRMDEFIGHDDLWLRRVAILHQLAWKERTDRERLFAYCLHCADDPDFFIRKAIGWALRQYARVAPEAVGDFIAANRHRLSPLSLREAGKHLQNSDKPM